MRNSGWYIPYWRKPKKKGRQERPSTDEITRSDEQLEAVRQRWVERYRRTTRALRLMGLSVGSNRSDVQVRYEALRGADTLSERELEDAYRHLTRALPPQERRKRRSQPAPAGTGVVNQNGAQAGHEPGAAMDDGAAEEDAEGSLVEDDADDSPGDEGVSVDVAAEDGAEGDSGEGGHRDSNPDWQSHNLQC